MATTDSMTRELYIAHPGSGLARSNFPVVCQMSGDRIVRCLPFYIPDDVRLYEIRTSRGSFTRARREVQMPLAYAWQQRVNADSRVGYPLLRSDWSPSKPNQATRGTCGYSRISWDDALDIIAGQLEGLYKRYGSMEPVLVQADGHGQSGYLHSLHFWGHYLFDMLREHRGWGWWTQQVRNPDSWEGYYWGAKHVWGFDESLGNPYQDAVWDDVLENTELVIFSGNDPEATGLGMSGTCALYMTKWLKQAGIKILAISPDLNYAGAVHADKWIPIKPNTDGAMYLGIAHAWIAEGLYDKAYVATHTVGFDAFRAYVLGEDDGVPKDPQWAESITGIPAHTLRALAREWANRRTSLSVYFGGPKIRGTFSHIPTRMEAYLLAMQGIGKPGRQFLRTGAPSFYKKNLAQVPRYPHVDARGTAFSPMIEYAIGHGPKSPSFIPRTLATDAIMRRSVTWKGTTAALAKTEDQFNDYRFPPHDEHPGIKMIWNENGSQPGSWGHGWQWLEALRSPQIEFVLGVHPWMENDIPFSDLILPAQTSYEHEDLIVVQRSDLHALFFQDRALEPVGESLSDYEIHKAIGERLGLDERAFPAAEEYLRTTYETTLAFTELGITWDEFRAKKHVIYDCPTWDEWVEIKKGFAYGPNEGGLSWYAKAGGGLQTPSGKIEFASRGIAERDADSQERPPVARWVEHAELQSHPRSSGFPFLVVTNHPRFRFHVQGDDIPWIREIGKVQGPDGYLYEPCWIHPDDAEAKGIVGGDVVIVENERGAVLVGAVVTERIIPSSILVEHGAKLDLIELNGRTIDRGGCINLIAPSSGEKYRSGDSVRIPEMNVSGFLVDIRRLDAEQLAELPPSSGGMSGSERSERADHA